MKTTEELAQWVRDNRFNNSVSTHEIMLAITDNIEVVSSLRIKKDREEVIKVCLLYPDGQAAKRIRNLPIKIDEAQPPNDNTGFILEAAESEFDKAYTDLHETILINRQWVPMEKLRQTAKKCYYIFSKTSVSGDTLLKQAGSYAENAEKTLGINAHPKTASFHGYYHGYQAGASHRARQEDVRKTLDECKDEVARKHEAISELDLIGSLIMSRNPEAIQDYVSEVATLYAQTKAVEPQEGWVDVKDRLPETFERIGGYYVLVYGRGKLCYGDVVWVENNLFISNDGDVTDLVTHWMPLPNSPKQ